MANSNKEGVLQAKKKLDDAVSESIQAYDALETQLAMPPVPFLPTLRAVLAGDQAPPCEGQAATPAPYYVFLNVGGAPFKVERAVLTAMKGSKLGRVFEQGWDSLLPKSEDGHIFLDLHIEQFEPIMRWVKQYMAQDNLPEHPELMINAEVAEEMKWGFPALLAELGLGSLGTMKEAQALRTKQAFLAKADAEAGKALQAQIKKPVAEEIIQAIRDRLPRLQQSQPEQMLAAQETIALFEAIVQWERALAMGRAESGMANLQLDKEKKFLQHLAGQGLQEPGKREPARIIQVWLRGRYRFKTFRATLSQCPSIQLPPVDNQAKEDCIHLDYDPVAFGLVVQHLRHCSLGLKVKAQLLNLPEAQEATMEALLRELGLAGAIKLGPPPPPSGIDSLIMNEAQKQGLWQLLKTVNVGKLKLLYRGSRDGFTAQQFHALCDNKGRTVTMCRSKQHHICGAYSDVAFDSSGQFKQSNAAFLFKLGVNQSLSVSRHSVQAPHQAVYCVAHIGPTFGIGGNDLWVALNHGASTVWSALGPGYGYQANGLTTLVETGSTYAPLQELEVFAAS